MAITKYHRMGGLTTEIYFLTVPEAGKSKIKVLSTLVSGEGSLPGLQMAAFSLCPHTKEKASSLVSLRKKTLIL